MAEQGTLFADCSHDRVEEILLSHGPHYGKRLCADCHHFLSWIPKPETLKRQQENAEILTALSKLTNLPPWERQFIRDVVTHKHISPRQQAKLLELRDKFLKGGIANDGFNGEKVSPN